MSKKIFVSVLISIYFISMFLPIFNYKVEAANKEVKAGKNGLGDFNTNGYIDSKDITYLSLYVRLMEGNKVSEADRLVGERKLELENVDVYKDGKIDRSDVDIIVRKLNKKIELPYQPEIGDVDFNGMINDNDKELIKKHIKFKGYFNGCMVLNDAQKLNADINKDGKVDEKDLECYDNAKLEINLLKNMNDKKENIVYSPLSVKYALSMLSDGANGKTKSEINNVLGNAVLPTYQNIEKTLSVANVAFVKNKYKDYVKKDYEDILASKYNADLKIDSFENAKNINNWVKENTFGKITEVLNDKYIQDNKDLAMLLINAVALDMEWKVEFEGSYTDQFKVEDGKKVNVDMMYKKTDSQDIYYNINKETTSLKMDFKDYNGTQLEFIAIMPNEEKLSDYIKNLSTVELNKTIQNMTSAKDTKNGIEIRIPKFSIEYETKLKENLEKLGIKTAFDKYNADFTNIMKLPNKNCNLYVNDILHKATIKFTEKGSEAAAVTTVDVQMMGNVMGNEPEVIAFDKPFMYVIRDKNNGEIFFMGTVYNPTIK